jgi:DNA-directed RNA polymerase subunit RPC12/RpoP
MVCGGCKAQVEVEVIDPGMPSAAVLHQAFLLDDMEDDTTNCPDCGMRWGFRNARPKPKVVQ